MEKMISFGGKAECNLCWTSIATVGYNGSAMIIHTPADLQAFCEEARHATVICLDTEFVGEGRYYAEVGAIQVATPERAVLIDPLALPDLSPLVPLLTDPGIEKVFHAGGQDLAIFFRLFGQPVAPIFDTQIAAALLGYDEQMSFVNLVARVTRVQLAKSHSFSDWLRRPLSAGQVEYALDDVRYLLQIHQKLVQKLECRGRLAWAREEFTRLELADRFQTADPRELYARIRGVERLGGKALAILREVVAWREETARALNIPPGRIVRDETLLDLARHPRSTVKELRELRGVQPGQMEKLGPDLLAALSRGADAPPPALKRHTPLAGSHEPSVDFLVLCLRALAAEQEVSSGLLATRGDLAVLVQDGPCANIPLMRGWRREAVGDALLATLEGKARASIDPRTRQVHLEWHSEGFMVSTACGAHDEK
jgi:ribonuclease D